MGAIPLSFRRRGKYLHITLFHLFNLFPGYCWSHQLPNILGLFHCILPGNWVNISFVFQVEATHLKLLRDMIGKKGMSEAIERFNCNVPYSGLLHSVTQDVSQNFHQIQAQLIYFKSRKKLSICY